jgi:hypothetical protein
MTASETITEGTGDYKVFILPDADDVGAAVDTGLVLSLGGKDSAIVNFTGVIRGIKLKTSNPIDLPNVKLSAVISSFSRYRQSVLYSGEEEKRDTVSTELEGFNLNNDISWTTPNHSNMIYHQLSLSSEEPQTDAVYEVRIIPESERPLETSVSLGIELDFAGNQSAMVYFGSVMTGIHLRKISGDTTNKNIEVILSSSVERYDEVVTRYITIEQDPVIDNHINNFSNPHQVTYDQLLGDKPEDGYALVRAVIPPLKEFIVHADHQYLVWESLDIEGSVTIQPDGEVVVLHDRPEESLEDPDFTYNLDGEMIQIDYADGSQKVFTYDVNGNLIQVDSLRDGTTHRKTFTYTGGGELDYITGSWT